MAKSVDRFELMKLFVRIAETGSLSAAGRSLGLSQPSASRQLRDLEASLGVQLVMRSTHELSLTEAGQRFLTDARRLLADWETVAEQIKLDRGELEGRIRLLAPTGFGQTVLADMMATFIERHPKIRIEVTLSDKPADLIADGIDLWLRVGSIPDTSLVVRDLWRIERVLACACEGSPKVRHPSKLGDAPAIVISQYVGASVDLQGPAGEAYRLEPNALVTTDNIFTAHNLARRGLGYTILPLWLIDEDIKAGYMKVLCPSWRPACLNLSLAYPTGRFRPARVSEFISFMRRELPNTGAGISAA
ncbi:MAG: LysR family transcriptional regulator [Filomicrobium sp.]